MVGEYRAKYPRRFALLEGLAKLGGSWLRAAKKCFSATASSNHKVPCCLLWGVLVCKNFACKSLYFVV